MCASEDLSNSCVQAIPGYACLFNLSQNPAIPVSYYFIDTYLFANVSGCAGAMFPIDKLGPVMTRISTEIDQHYRPILTGEPDIWRKLFTLAKAPREKTKLP